MIRPCTLRPVCHITVGFIPYDTTSYATARLLYVPVHFFPKMQGSFVPEKTHCHKNVFILSLN
jgi:hypothetical protein